MRKNLITDYSRGELSPLLEGRLDLDFYNKGYSFGENIIPLTPSGFSIRPGTYHNGETFDSTDYTILIPKKNVGGDGYIIEMGDEYARVWKDGVLQETTAGELNRLENTYSGIIPHATTPDDGTAGVPAAQSHNISCIEDIIITAGDQEIQFDWTEKANALALYNMQDVSIFVNSTYHYITVGTTTHTVTGLTNGVSYSAIISTRAAPSEVRHIYTGIPEEALAGMTWIQEGETIQFASHNFHPRAFEFKGVSAPEFWHVSETLFNSEQWEKYEQVYIDEIRQYSDGVYYTCIKTLQGTALENIPSAEPTFWNSHGTTPPTGLKPFASSALDYPAVVSVHEGRRIYGNSNAGELVGLKIITKESTIWGSKAGDSDIYATGPHDDSPWEHSITLSDTRAIRWMESTESGIIVGSLGGEWKVQGGELGITPATILITRLSEFGSSPIGARLMGSQLYFFGNSGEDLYNYFFQERASAYQSIKISEAAEHILSNDYYTDFQENTQYGGGGVKSFGYQNDPQKIFWMIKNSGQLIGMNITSTGVSWHKHTTKKGQFQSMAIVPSAVFDEVYFIVKREIDSVTHYFVEKMGDLDIHQDIDNYHLVDCGIAVQADSSPDLTHLDGEEVAVSIMGKHTAVKTVASNTIDILEDYPSAAVSTSSLYYLNSATAHIGLFTEARIRTMRQGFPTTPISAGPVTLRLFKSFGGAITEGVSPGELQYLEYPPAPENNNLSSPYETVDINDDDKSVVAYKNLFSGEKGLDYIGDWNESGYLWIVQDKPVPFVVLGMYTDLEDGE